MPKRPATEQQAPPSKSHASGRGEKPQSQRQLDANASEMGEFEDAWEDEIESDEDVVDGQVEESAEDGERISLIVCH
jgi:ribosome assembly protein RRB1